MKTKREVITRFCELAREVQSKVFNYDLPADCFCGLNQLSNSNHYSFADEIMHYIETAVINKIQSGGKENDSIYQGSE